MLRLRQHQLRAEDPFRLEAGVLGAQPGQGAQHQTGEDEEHQGDRQLDDRQGLAQPFLGEGAAGQQSLAGADVKLPPVPGGAEGGYETDRHADDERQQKGQGDDGPVDPSLLDMGDAAHDAGQQQVQVQVGREEPHDTPQEGEKQALQQELADQPAAAGTERRPRRQLLVAVGRPRQQQVDQVDAGDQQHESDGHQQKQEDRPDAAYQIFADRGSIQPSADIGHRVFRRQLADDAVQVFSRGGESDSRLETADALEVARRAILSRQPIEQDADG